MTETELLACEIRVRDGRPRRAIFGPLHPASDAGDALCEIQFRVADNYAAARKGHTNLDLRMSVDPVVRQPSVAIGRADQAVGYMVGEQRAGGRAGRFRVVYERAGPQF